MSHAIEVVAVQLRGVALRMAESRAVTSTKTAGSGLPQKT